MGGNILKRNKKILINILSSITLLSAFISGKLLASAATVVWLATHVALGVAFFILVFVHLQINGRGWIDAGKRLFMDEKYKKVRGRYIADWFLLIVWSIVLLTGFSAIEYNLYGEYFLLGLGKAHAIHHIASLLGVVLIATHIIQHKKQIKSYLVKNNK